MFKEQVMCAFKEMRRVKHCCNFLIMKPEERCLFRNPQVFQGLDIVGTHVTTVATTTNPALWQASRNQQACHP